MGDALQSLYSESEKDKSKAALEEPLSQTFVNTTVTVRSSL